jgi:Fe-S-cluster containining protein
MMNLNVVTDDTRFECQRCTKCCSLDVMLSGREMRELQPHVDQAWHTTEKRKKGSGFVCCLLEGIDCSIYKNRPLLCRLYPFFAVPSEQLALLGEPVPEGALTLNGSGGGHFYFIFDEECPGMGKGGPITLEGILELTLKHLSEMDAKSPK